MNQQIIHTHRIRLIAGFLNVGGGTLEEMQEWVNKRLEDQGKSPIGLRTLQLCLEKLRKGEFDHSQRDLPRETRCNLFKVLYQGQIYRWAPDSQIPAFGDLDENERFTLPFLVGILKKFETIPSVQKILYQLPEIFNITEEEMESRLAIFLTGPQLYDEKNPSFDNQVVECVIRILSFISKKQAIEFNYIPVNTYDNKIENLVLHQLVPLQIRYYEYYYYLIAADIKTNQLLNFRVDQIHRFNISPLTDEQNKPIMFDREKVERLTDLKNIFQHSLGVWIHSKNESLHRIEIEFSKWAASYMKRMKLHPSQEIVKENKADRTITISLKLPLAEKTKAEQIMERNPELAFLLGRFGKDCRVRSALPI